MSRSERGGSYHHGDLRRALLDTAVARARAAGPAGVVLRDIARQIGVSPTAAYRHFTDREALLGAVAAVALEEMSAAMRHELVLVGAETATKTARERALRRFAAVGRGYLSFARAEPGLFRTGFTGGITAVMDRGSDPATLLAEALDELVAARVLTPQRRDGADIAAWAAVHGLAILVLDRQADAFGAVGSVDAAVERVLAMVIEGL